jgi:hypothetical protein
VELAVIYVGLIITAFLVVVKDALEQGGQREVVAMSMAM